MDSEKKYENFDDAASATQDMFSAPDESVPSEEEQQQTPIDEEQSMQQEVSSPEQMANQAVQAADTAVNVAQQKDNELQQILQELNAVKEQNSKLQNAMQQMSQQQEMSIEEKMTGNSMPVLDFNGLAFADEDTVKNAQSEYASQMSDFVKNNIMQEITPFVEQAKEGLLHKEKEALFQNLKDVPELAGIDKMSDQLDNIIKNNSVLSNNNIPLDEKYITAYAIAKGVDSINNPKREPSIEELMNYYSSNKDFKDMVEKKRIEEIQKSQQVPPMSASSGAVNAALNIKEKPKTFEEASELTRHMFGMN